MEQQLFDTTQNRTIKLDAQPQPVVIDTVRTAVIVVDMQNDFGAPGGMFDRAGLDISMIQAEVVGQDLLRSNHDATLWLVQGRFGWVSDSDTFIQVLPREPVVMAQQQR